MTTRQKPGSGRRGGNETDKTEGSRGAVQSGHVVFQTHISELIRDGDNGCTGARWNVCFLCLGKLFQRSELKDFHMDSQIEVVHKLRKKRAAARLAAARTTVKKSPDLVKKERVARARERAKARRSEARSKALAATPAARAKVLAIYVRACTERVKAFADLDATITSAPDGTIITKALTLAYSAAHKAYDVNPGDYGKRDADLAADLAFLAEASATVAARTAGLDPGRYASAKAAADRASRAASEAASRVRYSVKY